jgi:hypothetical protein
MLVNGINLTSSLNETFFHCQRDKLRNETREHKIVCEEKKKKVFLCVIRVIFFETKSIKFDIQMEVGHNKSNYGALHRGEFRGAALGGKFLHRKLPLKGRSKLAQSI